MKRQFRIFDLALESDIPFPELDTVSSNTAALVLRHASGEEAPEPADGWFRDMRLSPDERPWLRVGRAKRGLLLQFPDRLTLLYEPPLLHWWRHPALDDDDLRHLLLNQALPLIVAHNGRTVLHAACVTRDGRATAIAGPAGAGKSTLAAALGCRGWGVEGDDAVAVNGRLGRVVARPAYPGVRLWPDSRAALGIPPSGSGQAGSRKQRFRMKGSAAGALPLAAICVLDASSEARRENVRRLSGQEAVIGLLRNAYVLDTTDRARASAHLRALSDLAAATPVFEVSPGRDLASFDRIERLLRDRLFVHPVF